MPRLKSSKPEYNLPPKPASVTDWARRAGVSHEQLDEAMLEIIASGEEALWIRAMVNSRRNKVAW